MSTDETGLITAHLLDGEGGSRDVDWAGVRSWTPADGVLWVHADRKAPQILAWLADEAGLDDPVREALVAEDPRPRSMVRGEALLVILRGVNMNPGADPDDMVSIRMWVEEHRIITLRHRRVMAVDDLREAFRTKNGARTAGEFLVELTELLANRTGDVLADLEDSVDALEDEVLTAERYELRTRLAEIRRQAIGLRRYLAPQRDAMARLYSERVPWLSEMDRVYLREVSDRVTRHVEDIDAARERATVAQDTLNGRLSEQMNRNMYVISIVAAVFLPLGLLTGLLGINVDGMPGSADTPWAFAAVCGLLAALAVFEIWLFKRKRWI